jgi:protein-tyrosine phosphatase
LSDSPLRVDWLPDGWAGDALRGRLGLTILPGKHGASTRYPGRVYDRVLDADLAALRAFGVVRLVLLVDDAELARWGPPVPTTEWDPPVVRFPMPDGSPPRDAETMDRILAAIDQARAIGNVAVACMGGVGRSGTVAACAIVAHHGGSAAEAIATVRRVRHPEAVETPAQERFVRDYAARVAAGAG